MPIYDCQRCGFIYNTFTGDTKNGVPEKTPLTQLKATLCQDCGMSCCHRKQRDTKDYTDLEVEAYPYFCGQTSALVYTQDCEHKCVLDVGAGCGKVGLAFAKRGSYVTCLEKSANMVQQLKKLEQRFEHLTILHQDILEATLGSFDIIVASDGLFQHLKTPSEQMHVLEKLTQALHVGGELFVELFIPEAMQMQTKRVKEIYADTHYYMDVYAQLDLIAKEIRTELVIEKVVQQKVLERARFERLLALILLSDMERMIEVLNAKASSVQYELSACQRFDHSNQFDYYKMPSSEQHCAIKSDWIQTGYPFSTTDSQQVSWWRLKIIKKAMKSKSHCCCPKSVENKK